MSRDRRRDRSGAQREPVDVCLVLEGTYPFVPGGVSSWVHHLVTHMPELSFGVLHISPAPGCYGKLAYEMPANVAWLDEIHLTGAGRSTRRQSRASRDAIRRFWSFANAVRAGDTAPFADYVRAFAGLDRRDRMRAQPAGFFTAAECWDALVDVYRAEAGAQSFLDFFWTWYFAYHPLLTVLTTPIPAARTYHTVSTGYAGVLAAAAQVATGRPMILTEHGIYTKERRIEIHSARWIRDRLGGGFAIPDAPPYFRALWNRHFETMSRICYERAERIFTLYADNARAQQRDGADPSRIEVVPNGVDIAGLDAAVQRAAARARSGERPRDDRFTLAFVGRVCPIKDVRTFLAAVRLVAKVVPDVRARVLGPMEEDAEYARDCVRFASELGLDDNVSFEGRVAIRDELPGVDVLVLTSISEAMPLVVLEAGAMAIPVVTTDVGSCRELLVGRTPEDRALGVGGLLTPIASPGATARAILALFMDPEMRVEMGQSLRARVRAHYDQADMVAAYRAVYAQAIAQGAASARDRAAPRVPDRDAGAAAEPATGGHATPVSAPATAPDADPLDQAADLLWLLSHHAERDTGRDADVPAEVR